MLILMIPRKRCSTSRTWAVRSYFLRSCFREIHRESKESKNKGNQKLLSSKKARDEKGQFVLEGPKAIEAYVQSGGKVLELLYSKDAKTYLK